MAHRVILRQCSTSVAFGAKRTLSHVPPPITGRRLCLLAAPALVRGDSFTGVSAGAAIGAGGKALYPALQRPSAMTALCDNVSAVFSGHLHISAMMQRSQAGLVALQM